MNKLKLLIKLRLWEISIIKTLYFNFHYLPFKQAILFPCFVYRRTYLKEMEGGVSFCGKVRPGLFKLGLKGPETLDSKYDRTIWACRGSVLIQGKAYLKSGCKISVDNNGILTLGDNFIVNGNSKLICQKSISFGSDCLLSWDITIMDTDLHFILDENGRVINEPLPIVIGEKVWIGFGSSILKGVSIANNTIIAANSTITKSWKDNNVIIGGSGNHQAIIKKQITWTHKNPNLNTTL